MPLSSSSSSSAAKHCGSPRILLLALLASAALAQNGCNTNQNPYCKNDSAFKDLCCPYPAKCYYVNRDGAVGCCPEGQTCDTCEDEECTSTQPNPQPIITVTPTPTPTPVPQPATVYDTNTVSVTVSEPCEDCACETCGYTTTTSCTTSTPTPCEECEAGGTTITITSSTGGGGVYSTVTEGGGGVFSTVTSAAAAGFSTVSGVLVGNAAPGRRSEVTEIMYLLFGVLGALAA